MSETRRIVVVGASLAGVTASETLRRNGFHGQLTLVGAETHFPPYDRPPLSKAGLVGAQLDPVRLRVEADLELDLRLGRSAAGLDVTARQVWLDDGTVLDYDGLVIATGAAPRTLPFVAGRANVHVLRTVEDAARLRVQLGHGVRVAVVGAGVLGCEIAATCRGVGATVTLIDTLAGPMVRVLGTHFTNVLAELHGKHGVDLRMGHQIVDVSDGPVAAVLLDTGEVVDADVVVVAVGAAPQTGWLNGSGLSISDGVVCDEACFAVGAQRSVVAAGDVARWFHPLLGTHIRVEHWTNAVTQAETAAANLHAALTGGSAPVPYAALPYFWSDQYDWKLQFVGVLGEEIAVEEGSVEDGRLVVSYRSAGRLTGALCVNCPSQVGRWRRRITEAMRA